MRLDWLRGIGASPGPFATVIMDATHDTEDAAHQDELRRRGVRDDLAAQGAPESVLDTVEAALAEAEPADGTAGRVLVADEKQVLLHELTPAPPTAPVTDWAPVPDLLAVATAVPEGPPVVVVRIDESGGEVLAPGEDDPEQVAGRTKPVHKVRAGGPSHLSMQEHVEETWRRNTAEVAARVDARARAAGAKLVVITGAARARSRLLDALSEHSAAIAVGVEHSAGAAPGELPDTVAAAVRDLIDERRRAAVDHYRHLAGRPDGLAVTGLTDVVAAARAHAIETLLLDPATLTSAPVWVGPEPALLALDADELSTLGVSGAEPAGAVSALIRAAAGTGADLVVLDDPERLTGRDPLDDPRPPEPTAGRDTGESVEDDSGPEGADRDALVAHGDLVDGVGAVLRFPIGPT